MKCCLVTDCAGVAQAADTLPRPSDTRKLAGIRRDAAIAGLQLQVVENKAHQGAPPQDDLRHKARQGNRDADLLASQSLPRQIREDPAAEWHTATNPLVAHATRALASTPTGIPRGLRTRPGTTAGDREHNGTPRAHAWVRASGCRWQRGLPGACARRKGCIAHHRKRPGTMSIAKRVHSSHPLPVASPAPSLP